MTNLRTAITDGLLGRKPLLAQDIAADGRAEGLLCLHGQVWALHDAVPEHLPAADVDFIRGVVHPVQQWPNKPLKTDGGAAPIPIAITQDLALLLSASAQRWPGEFLVTSDRGRGVGPWLIERVPYARPRSTSPRMTRS